MKRDKNRLNVYRQKKFHLSNLTCVYVKLFCVLFIISTNYYYLNLQCTSNFLFKEHFALIIRLTAFQQTSGTKVQEPFIANITRMTECLFNNILDRLEFSVTDTV